MLFLSSRVAPIHGDNTSLSLTSCSYDTAKGTRGSCIFVRILSKMCADLAILAIGSWGEAEITLEDLGQVALAGKSALDRDVSKGDIRLFEQALRVLDPLVQYKLVRTFPDCLTEQACKVIGAEADLLSQNIEREILVEMSLHELHHLLH